MNSKSTSEYWYCIIGPVDRDLVPEGGDGPPRMGVRNAVYNMTGIDPPCWSGWGMDEEEKREIDEVQHKYWLKRRQNGGNTKNST